MKKIVFGAMVLLGIMFGMSSCSTDDFNKEQPEGLKGVELTGEIILDNKTQEMIKAAQMPSASNETTQNRTVVNYDPNNGNISYNWEKGREIPLLIYITDGTKHTALTSSMLKIVSSKLGRFTFTVPADYDLSKLKVAAATGKENNVNNGAWASEIDSNGNITIGTPTVVDATSNEYNIPLYSKLTPLSADRTHVEMTFSMLGSWIGVRAKSDMYYASNIYSVALESDVLHMDGRLNLSTATPTWTPGNYRIDVNGAEKTDTIVVNGVVIGGAAAGLGTTQYTKPVYVWAKATDGATSTQKARVYIRGWAATKEGPIHHKLDKFYIRNKFYREAKQVETKYVEGDAYYFNVNANLRDEDGGLILTEFFHSTLAIGEYNWIEITNATNKTISLDGYYLVGYNPESKVEYVMSLKDLKLLDRNNKGLGFPNNSATEIPAGQSICLSAGNNSFDFVVGLGTAYQVVNTGSSLVNKSAVTGGIRSAKYICKGGYNINFNDPNNNIVDNLGTLVRYDQANDKYKTYFYYLGNVTFIRVKEDALNVPQKNFLPDVWNYMAVDHDHLGTFNDKNNKFTSLTGYSGGSAGNFAEYSIVINKTEFRP